MKTENMITEELLERLSLGRERLGQIPQEARFVLNGALPEQEKQEKGAGSEKSAGSAPGRVFGD